MLVSVFQILVIAIFPIVAIRANEFFKLASFLSPIVLCFGVGIILGNLPVLLLDNSISNFFRDFTILLALPLLLFSSNIQDWKREMKGMTYAFLLSVLSGVLATVIAAFLFSDKIESIWNPSAMMVGINSGGTPNLFAVGQALSVPENIIILTNSAQILCGAIYLLFLLSIAPGILLRILPKDEYNHKKSLNLPYTSYVNIQKRDVFHACLFAGVLISGCAMLSHLIYASINPTFVIISLTTMAIASSLHPRVNQWKGTFEIGDYFLLMFGVVVGMTSDFFQLIEEGGAYIQFVGAIFLFTIVIQIILSKLFRIGSERHIMASTAAIYGPVFIPQVARAIKNKELLIGGMTASMIGLAIGNYLGISVSYLLKSLLS